jgi:uncharacterized phage protein (TIGR02220 family)
MAKDPAFLFYPGDWLGGTQLFNRYHKGCYMDLLMAQFANGRLTLEDIQTVLGNDDYVKYWESKLRAKFKVDENGLFYNEKLETEIIKRKKFVGSRTENLNGDKKTETDKVKHKGNHKRPQMENENDNGDVIVLEKENANPKNTIAEEVLTHFNLICGKKVSIHSETYHKKINGRLKEGYTKQDLFEIIELMHAKWVNDEKMKQYIHPDTLFNKEKAEKYRLFVQEAKDNGLTLAQVQGKKVKKDAATLTREAMALHKSRTQV